MYLGTFLGMFRGGIVSVCLGLLLVSPVEVWAGGKKKPQPQPPLDGKKVVALTPVDNIQIEMPDQSIHNFGEDFQASLTTQLMQSGRYIVSDPLLSLKQESLVRPLEQPDYQWAGSVTPVATLRVRVDSLSFSTGTRGDRMFYGFDERFQTPFNDGTGKGSNEFPLRQFIPNEPSWFGNVFGQKGESPFDSRSGLDLGDGFQIDFLFAWLNVKYAEYHSELHLSLFLDDPLGGPPMTRLIQVKGDGFFFDVSGGYEQFSAGITLARKDAMNQALKKALAGTFGAVDRALTPLPLMAKVDAVLKDGTVLLGTGPDSKIRAGVLYEVVDHPQDVIQVSSCVTSGAIGHLAHGDVSEVKAQQILRQVYSLPSTTQQANQVVKANSNSLVAAESIQLPNENLPASPLGGLVPTISRWDAFWKSLVELIFLPYRIWRYYMYDQAYHLYADWGDSSPADLSREPWAGNVGFSWNHVNPREREGGGQGPIVAVIDSGVDYNHPALHDSLWLNPSPWQDPNGKKDYYGWDFISDDPHPYDDGYHGTQVVSLILAVAPQAKIMPLKVFNPWGVTNSAALSAAFTYAVDHGARIIVCAWATNISSRAIELGVEYARDHGVAVVAAAGDMGMSLSFAPFYPAVLSKKYSNVLTVTGVDWRDQLIHTYSRIANYDPNSVLLAVPGEDIPVAEPRAGVSRDTSTGLAAAIAAGGLVRYLDALPDNENTQGELSGRGLQVSQQALQQQPQQEMQMESQQQPEQKIPQDPQQDPSQELQQVAQTAPEKGPEKWIAQMLQDADVIPSLESAVKGGLRLHLRR